MRGSSPLYEALALATAGDPDLRSIAKTTLAGQPVPNLFFAAVHYLLLAGTNDRLAEFYPSLTAQPGYPEEAFPSFRAFCLDRRQAIERILGTRRVQTNEVARCAYLYPAFALVAELSRRPLAVIELGASAGLNLMWDQYRYDYDGATSCGERDATVLIRSTFRGHHRPRLPPRAPVVVDRVGVDLDPIDVRNDDQVLWLRALVWPEHRQRATLLASAVTLARRSPPRIVRGDASACLPDVLREARRDAAVCVTHTHTLNQVTDEGRAALSALLDESSRELLLYRVSAEWLTTAYPVVELTSWTGAGVTTRRLAVCDPHGAWVEWLVDQARDAG